MTHSFELDFIKPKKGDPIGLPHARIYIKAYTTNIGLRYITPDCVSMRAFTAQIDRLIKELEELKRKAKKQFAPYDTKISK
jgi:hypothetical protein